ncbi:MAG TPA: efflux RND transporter periplasmic adaptor subunit [Blastocatellia bacterium]|nr:efflux RND transporter periplasmic adaptor subunit [Blastocatellia bacterium]
MKTSRTIRLISSSVLCALVAAAIVLVARSSTLRAIVRGSESEVEEVTVEKQSLRFWVTASGTLRATSSRSFAGPPSFGDYWQFQIVSMAPEGQAVKNGDLIIKFDSQKANQDLMTFQNELDQATKELERAKVQIDLEEKEIEGKLSEAENRREKLRLKQGMSPTVEKATKIELDALEYEQANREVALLKERLEWHKKSSEANYRVIESKKVRAENKLKELQRGIDNFSAKADRDGVLIYKTRWNGERFQVGESVWSGQPIAEIPDLNTIVAEALVPEVDIGKVKIDQRAEVSIDAFPGKTYEGTVKNIGTLVRPKSWDIPNKVLEVRIALDHLDTSVMRPAMSINVKIETDRAEDQIAVPLRSVVTTSDGSFVKTKSQNGWIPRAVKLGRSNGRDVAIVEGLSAGERIAADYTKAH